MRYSVSKKETLTVQHLLEDWRKAVSSTEESSSTSATADSEQASGTTSNAVVEELKKEFEQYNQHNIPRDKKKAEERVPRRTRSPSKKDYQRSRGRNKR